MPRRRVLLLAYMFPPIVDAGGFRPLAFSRYLPEFGWDPIVLTRPDTGALPLDPKQLTALPPNVRVERVATGFRDGWQRHFEQRLRWLRPFEAALGKPRGWIAEAIAWRVARRDETRQWEVSWMQPAVESGLELISRERPDAILATAPPYETLKAGWQLHRRTGVPFIADYRDPWTYGVPWNPGSARRARLELAWERKVMRDAARILVVTPSMQRTMAEKYPASAGRIELVMNGYEDFRESSTPPSRDRFVMSYVGSVMERRFPPVLFEALRRLRTRHPETTSEMRVQFIGPNQCAGSPNDTIKSEDLMELVHYLGPVGHDAARELMRSSNVLLHIETEATYAVSSKLFEYFSARRAVLGLVPSGSDDELFLQRSGAGFNAGIDDPDRIAAAIYERWCAWRDDRLEVSVDDVWLKQFHRRGQTQKVAALLEMSIDVALSVKSQQAVVTDKV
jgi:glycosyltransferase involved in cell wall biosynthesis